MDNNNLCYSFYIKNNEDKVGIHKNRLLYAQTINQNNYWQPDAETNNCNNCLQLIRGTFFTSNKHHCRLCGKIFCESCSKYQDLIPEELKMADNKKSPKYSLYNYFYNTTQKELVKTCINCHELLILFENMIKICKLFKVLNLNIIEINKLKGLNQVWFYSARYLQSIFRSIQYKLPYHKYTSIEKKLLFTNLNLFPGHRKYLLHSFKVCENNDQIEKIIEIINNEKTVSCWDLMCSRSCKEKLHFYDFINLYVHYIDTLKNTQTNLTSLLHFIVDNISCSDTEFKNCIIILTYYSQFEQRNEQKYKWSNYLMQNYLIERSSHNIELARYLYYEIKYNTVNYTNNINNAYFLNFKNNMEIMLKHTDQINKFIDCDRFLENLLLIFNFDKLENLYDDDNNIKHDNLDNKYPSPLNFNDDITSVFIKSSTEFVSKTKPIKIPYLVNNKITKYMIFKKENVRQDQIATNIINLINDIIISSSDIDPNIVSYEILPLNANDKDPYNHRGIIEMVQSCDTLINISTNNTNISNYLVANNSDITVGEIKKKFSNSCAAYSVISFLLGIGDRHLGNILVTKDGKLFHIDYGFILGQNPMNVGSMCRGEIRLTSNMIDVIGKEGTLEYLEFQNKCKKIYEICRHNADILSLLMLLIPRVCPLTVMSDEETIEFIKYRFCLDMTTEEAQNFITSKLQVCPLADLYDYLKEKTGGSNPSEAIKNGTYTVLSSITDSVAYAYNHANYLYSLYKNNS
ncbi:phosphoinositide 3-kinase [Hokovirus HKV1]|uniref:Phosphoinositide 3-kinase n=1 Tax=Hokovirus HKV1 TaxID=1977638 RepID=A0A1V0SFB2_9VIRU|nr:phosphoinositide 3-kinase [Hokovirus HKV1]